MRALLILALPLVITLLSTGSQARAGFWDIGTASWSDDAEDKSFALDPWLLENGKTIASITIIGRIRTAERAVRDLMGGHEGGTFDAQRWSDGIKKLYNTGALYDLRTQIKNLPDGTIAITLTLTDKWTLIPYASGQGGGGAISFGGGVYDVNLGGYFTNVSVGFVGLNQGLGYDFNLYQEWFLDTDWVFGLDFQNTPNLFSYSDATGGDHPFYYLFHVQQQLLLGRRLEKWGRFYTFLETYIDSSSPTGPGGTPPGPSLPQQRQWRLRPILILGRSDLTNTLEEGHEFTVNPVINSPWDPTAAYAQLNLRAKYTHIFRKADNFAAMIAPAAMTSGAAMPYELHLGGYDTVRGFTYNRFFATADLVGSLEYRPRILAFRWAFFDADLISLNACVFTDWAAAQSDIAQSADATGRLTHSIVLGSVGAGLRINFVKFAGAIVRLDFAQTVTPSEGWGFSFGVGQFF